MADLFSLGAMQTYIIPIISFNYAAGSLKRCRETLSDAIRFGLILMAAGALCFVSMSVFTSDARVIEIGQIGFRFIGISFLPMVMSPTFPVFFQAVGISVKSSLLTII